jgi:ATP-binding cassette subfamily B protein
VNDLAETENVKKRPIDVMAELSIGSRGAYAIACASLLIVVACNFLLPQLIRFLVDSVSGVPASKMPVIARLAGMAGLDSGFARGGGGLARAGLLVVSVALVGGFFNFTHRRALALGAEGLVKRLRDRLYSHIQRMPFEWHTSIQTGDIVQRCTSDVDIVRNFAFNQAIEIGRAVVLVVFAYGILFSMNFMMAAASFAFIPVAFLYSFIFLRKASAHFLAADEAEGRLLAIAQENFSGVRVVRAFGRERYEADRFAAQNAYFAELWIKLGNMLSSYWGIGDLITGIQMLMICAVGTYQAALGGITVGEFIVFLTYNSMIIWPVRGLGRALSEAGKTLVSLGRIGEILDSPLETDTDNALETPISGDIEFDHVSFSYGDTPVLKDVSFTVREGTTLGVLGDTGSGKTTLAYLLCRLYDLRECDGAIRIGGADIRGYKRACLRKNVGIALQEPFLYSRTIAENIAGLSKHFSLDRVKEAARISHVDAEIERFANAYDTVVGERGVTLSGGQRQRVAIARAVLKHTPIMIFDDSLSAVDTETDALIRAALRERVRGVTTIVISHRIATLSDADLIIVMESGRIAEMGTPAELSESGGIYRRILDLQQSIDGGLSGGEGR